MSVCENQMQRLVFAGLTALKTLGILWLFIASVPVLNVIWLETQNREYLQHCLRYNYGMIIAAKDNETAGEINFEFLPEFGVPSSNTHDIPLLLVNRAYKNKAFAWQKCLDKSD